MDKTKHKALYQCQSCQFNGPEDDFNTKLLSIMYRPKHDNFQSFRQVKCPKCDNLVTIIFETLTEGAK